MEIRPLRQCGARLPGSARAEPGLAGRLPAGNHGLLGHQLLLAKLPNSAGRRPLIRDPSTSAHRVLATKRAITILNHTASRRSGHFLSL
jgi:hypothetical protein